MGTMNYYSCGQVLSWNIYKRVRLRILGQGYKVQGHWKIQGTSISNSSRGLSGKMRKNLLGYFQAGRLPSELNILNVTSYLKQLRREAISCDPLSFRFNIGGRGSSHFFKFMSGPHHTDCFKQKFRNGHWSAMLGQHLADLVGERFNFLRFFLYWNHQIT